MTRFGYINNSQKFNRHRTDGGGVGKSSLRQDAQSNLMQPLRTSVRQSITLELAGDSNVDNHITG